MFTDDGPFQPALDQSQAGGRLSMYAAHDPKPIIVKLKPAQTLPEAVLRPGENNATDDWNEPAALRDIASILRSGGLVIYPTETFYALGAIPASAEAVEKVFEKKGRDFRKPLPLIAADREAVVSAAAVWPESAEALSRIFWPGPLSIVIEASASLPPVLHAGTGKIAIRVSSHPVASFLARATGGLIISTSANRAGELPPNSPGAVDRELLHSVDAFLDAGDLPGGLPSTIVDVTVGPAALIRAGKIGWEEIQRALEDSE